MSDTLPLIILNARPAAGKSEIIHFLRSLQEKERRERFHLDPLHIIDDFPMLWAWFEDDHRRSGKKSRPSSQNVMKA
jgi:hypothetical protein